MANINARHNQNEQLVLREVLNVLAANADPYHGITHLLEVIQRVCQAKGACLIVLEDPRSIIATGDVSESALPDIALMRNLAEALPNGINNEPTLNHDSQQTIFTNCTIAPIQLDGTRVGLLWVTHEPGGLSLLTNEHFIVLNSLIDALTTISRTLKADAHHDKLERNQSEFISIVSHDLRSPLTSMKGFAGMLESGSVGELNDQQIYFIQKILAGISQMTSLVDNIQDAGRYDPETGFYKMQRAHCDLTDMVARIVKNHLLPAEKQALSIHTAISDNVPIVNIDTHMIERAIINLVDNAIKYTPNGGNVKVGVERVDEMIVVSVRDSGLGISSENQVNLFERRVRIPREEHKRIKGSGLGLFIVRSAARRHSGDAWIESEEGNGSTFFIGIPLKGDNLIVPGEASV